jgi:hypothetical protein
MVWDEEGFSIVLGLHVIFSLCFESILVCNMLVSSRFRATYMGSRGRFLVAAEIHVFAG